MVLVSANSSFVIREKSSEKGRDDEEEEGEVESEKHRRPDNTDRENGWHLGLPSEKDVD